MCVGHFYKLTSLSTRQQQKDKVKLPLQHLFVVYKIPSLNQKLVLNLVWMRYERCCFQPVCL